MLNSAVEACYEVQKVMGWLPNVAVIGENAVREMQRCGIAGEWRWNEVLQRTMRRWMIYKGVELWSQDEDR